MDGTPAVEFTWDGHDEMDPVQGRGWMVFDGDELKGRLFIDLGDDSGIVLMRESETCFVRQKRHNNGINGRVRRNRS